MLKYGKPIDKKPQTLVSTLLSVLQMAVMIVGLIGLAVHLFKEKGWLSRWLGNLMQAETSQIVVAIPLLLLAGYLLNLWLHSADDDNKNNRMGDYMMYLMMMIGAFFIFNLVTTGSF